MLERETMLTLFEVTVESLSTNLDYIPSDNLNWKPAPDAKSALEIVNHFGEFVNSVSRSLNGRQSDFLAATNLAEAKQVLSLASYGFIEAVRAASSETLGEKFREDMPFTKGWIVTAAIMDSIHHHGQIAYIQTLLGDTEIHGGESGVADFAIG